MCSFFFFLCGSPPFFSTASFISHANPNTIPFLKEGIGGNFGLSAWTHPVCAEAARCLGPSFRDPYVYSRNVGWPYVTKELQKTVLNEHLSATGWPMIDQKENYFGLVVGSFFSRRRDIIHASATEERVIQDLCNKQEYSCNQMAQLGGIELCGIIYIL